MKIKKPRTKTNRSYLGLILATSLFVFASSNQASAADPLRFKSKVDGIAKQTHTQCKVTVGYTQNPQTFELTELDTDCANSTGSYMDSPLRLDIQATSGPTAKLLLGGKEVGTLASDGTFEITTPVLPMHYIFKIKARIESGSLHIEYLICDVEGLGRWMEFRNVTLAPN